jgi:hypothetical protein
MEKHHDSIGLCLVKNWDGKVPLAVMMDAVLVEAKGRLILDQTVAMLPRWAEQAVGAVLREVPGTLDLHRWQLKLLQRYGLISGLHYDHHRRCMMWECTELLAMVVGKMGKDSTTGNEEDTEGGTEV